MPCAETHDDQRFQIYFLGHLMQRYLSWMADIVQSIITDNIPTTLTEWRTSSCNYSLGNLKKNPTLLKPV